MLGLQAAVLRRLGDAEQAQVAHLRHHLVGRKGAGFLPVIDVRIKLLGDEGLDRAVQLLVFVRKLHYHCSTIFSEPLLRSEEHTSELQSLMRISYAVFCLTKKTKNT